MDFETALNEVLKHEGGYANHPSDPGGETMYGVTKRTAVAHGYNGGMKSIPLHIVRDIYRKSYWNAGKCDQLPPILRLIHFDSCVNSGVTRAARWLQTAVGTYPDGIIGPRTLTAASHAGEQELRQYAEIRLAFLQGLYTFKTFGRGWTNRVNAVLSTSLRE